MNKLRILWVALARFVSAPRISARDKIFFAKELSMLVAADVSLSESLSMIRAHSRSRGLTHILDVVIEDVQNGKTLARSLAKHPRVFGAFAIGVIAIGEASGTLGANLEYLASELKKRHALRRKIMSALLYPALITLATFALTCFLILYLFPKLMPIFLSLHAELPLSTRIVMAASQLLLHYGLAFMVLFALVAVALAVVRARFPAYRRCVAHVSLRLPLLATFIREYNIAQSTRSLGLLLKSGMPLSYGVAELASLAHNPLYKEAWESIAHSVNRGNTISGQLAQWTDLFPPTVVQMIAIGERSGDLSKSLLYIADVHESEFDEYTKSLSTLLEPVLMILMGLLIGTVAISIITPIYGLTEHLHS